MADNELFSELTMGEVIYEVDLHVDARIASAYQAWLREHMRQMLALPGFLAASLLQEIESTCEGVLFRAHYRLRDEAALQNYLQDHAPRMRSEGVALFGDAVTATRRVWRSMPIDL